MNVNKYEFKNQKRKTRKRIKNIILKSISIVIFTIMIVAICFVDSNSNIPYYVIVGCLLWVVPFTLINGIEVE